MIGLTSIVTGVSSKTSVNTLAATDPNIYYVSPGGSDSYNGLAAVPEGNNVGPWKTIQKAANMATAGKTVYIRHGVYQEKVNINNSGTASAPIRFLAYPEESPVIDGNNYSIPSTHYDFLVTISGNYINFKGIEIRKSKEEALLVGGNYSLVQNLTVHDNNASGIIITGDHSLVDGCVVYNNGQAYENCNWKSGFTAWGSSLACGPGSSYSTIKNCTSFNNWGEGISAYTSGNSVADHCTIEDSVSYNNGSVHLYIQNATNNVVQRNLIYQTADTPRSCAANVGLQLGDEGQSQCNTGHRIINNFVYGTWLNFSTDRDGGCTGNPLADTVIANNTFVNAKEKNYQDGYNMSIYFRSSQAYSNTVFKNNIIFEDTPSRLTPISVPSSHPGLIFSNNLYNKTYSVNAGGSNDIQADPKLAKTGPIGAGLLNASWFKLSSGSTAIDSGIVLADVNHDYFNSPRGNLPDIGAHEYQASEPVVTPTTSPSPTPVFNPTPTSFPVPTSTPIPQGNTVHIGSIKLKLVSSLLNLRTRAVATVTVLDQYNRPVSQASVTGSWSQVVSGVASIKTSSQGTAVFNSKYATSQGTFVFTVLSISYPGYTYDSTLNTETSDSILWVKYNNKLSN
jgi:parallel beta-helix repeat protein